MGVGDFALPVALLAGVWLLKEVKSFELPTFTLPKFKTVEEAVAERTEALQTYEAERATDALRIESERAATELAQPDSSYGTVSALGQAYTGMWFNTPGKAGDSCHVLFATSRGSNVNRFFTGPHCRQARMQGLIQ